MAHCTIYRTIEDCYSPDGEEITVEIEVEFRIISEDHSVGIMSAYAEDVCVVATDSDQCTPDQADAWLTGNDNDRERGAAWDRICDACADHDDDYEDD